VDYRQRPITTFTQALPFSEATSTRWHGKRAFPWRKLKKDDEDGPSSSKPKKPRVSSHVPVVVEEQPKPERELFSSEEISGEEIWDDIDDYLEYLAYMAEVSKEEGTVTSS
jgi:hypothetical protein